MTSAPAEDNRKDGKKDIFHLLESADLQVSEEAASVLREKLISGWFVLVVDVCCFD